MKILDMRNNPCPIPVIKAKKELENDTIGVTVIVDNIVAVENLTKMANGKGYKLSYEQKDDGMYYVDIIKGDVVIKEVEAEIPEEVVCEDCTTAVRGSTVLITSDTMGRGSDELGKILIKGFIFSLTELDVIPEKVIFINGGVKLVTEGSNTVEDIKTLEAKGTKIMACGTCLNYYELKEKLAVGEINDMMGISKALASAYKVVSI